jgi:NADH:ubiquinone oxidoreductase subunit 6 (subunit J)
MQPFPASQMIVGAVFLLCVLTTVAGALIAALTARIIRSVCGLAMACIGLAGLYYFLHSPFLALMEILIYVGAVCVTIVFAVMLAEPDEPVHDEKPASTFVWGGLALVVSGLIFWGLWSLGAHQDWTAPVTRVNDGSIAAIGRSLLTTYSMAFELISLALVVAIVGALAIARTGRTKDAVDVVGQASRLPGGRPAPGSEAGEMPGAAGETPSLASSHR